MKFTNPPRWPLNGAQWRDGANTQRNRDSPTHVVQRCMRMATNGGRRIDNYACDHKCSEREADDELFGD